MNLNIHVQLSATIYLCVLAAGALGADHPQLPENYEQMDIYQLDRTIKELAPQGFTDANRAQAFIQWMGARNWQALDINSLYHLYEWVSADSVDHRHFSARWTGFLTAPTTGAYTLRQVRVYKGHNSRLKITIDGHVVLDMTGDVKDSNFSSGPVQLNAGQAVSIQVDLVHKVNSALPKNDFSESAPMALVTWKVGSGTEAIIPSSAFSPPQGFGEAGSHGLKGQYFGNMEFGNLRSTRLDPALDLVWSWPPVAPIHQQESSAVFAECKSKLLDAETLADYARNRPHVLSYDMWRLAYRMTASDRIQLVQTIRKQPQVLRALPPAVMGRMMQAIYMLPGKEHIDLLGEWASAIPQPRCVAGEFPGYGEGTYQASNLDFYWLMGRFMQGPYTADIDKLCNQYLARRDGECNLAAAYAAAYASRLSGRIDPYFQRLDERINDKNLSGDKLATWLIARAYAKGAVPGAPHPLAGSSDLESAYMLAESNDHKFWALQETVSRLGTMNKADKAKALVEKRRGEFSDPQQQKAMADWTAKADALANKYAERKVVQKAANQQAHRKELERRQQAATARGDAAAAGRFAKLLANKPAAPEK